MLARNKSAASSVLDARAGLLPHCVWSKCPVFEVSGSKNHAVRNL